jgi:hypothetical protein
VTARKGLCIALTTALANWLIYYRIVEHYYFFDIAFITSALLVSLAIHELGHAIVLKIYGIRTYIVFAVIGAATLPYTEDREKFLSLRPQPKMLMAFGGVIANIVLVGISFLLYALHVIDHPQLVVMVYMGAVLILPNLLPLSLILSLDGSLFMQGFLEGTRKNRIPGYILAASVTLLAFVAGAWLFLSPLMARLAAIFSFLAQIGFALLSWRRHRRYREHPEWYLEARLVEPKILRRWMCLYLLLILIGILTAEFVIQSAL